MLIAGLQKSSFIDYPGKVSCVLFLAGCNFECPYCHNPELVNLQLCHRPYLSEKAVCEFLGKRKSLLDGVVISGGEPTLQKDLFLLCEKIKGIGFPLKLDTNGSRPNIIKSLIDGGLIDYIAMDIKTDPFRYSPVITKRCNPGRILSSIQIIMESDVSYEFRTTCVRPLVNEETVELITKTIRSAKRYVLQRFSNHKVLRPDYFKTLGSGYEEHDLFRLKSVAEPWVQECAIR